MSDTSETRAAVGLKVMAAIGLLPIIACAVQISMNWPLSGRNTGPALYALLLYGAVVLSFLGGSMWGRSLAADHGPNHRPQGTSTHVLAVVPLLAAWASAWIGGRTGLIGLALSFLAILIFQKVVRRPSRADMGGVGDVSALFTLVASVAYFAAAYFGPF